MRLRDEETQILYDFTINDQGEYIVEPIDDDQSDWHPHHALIVAYARGAELQFFDEGWLDVGILMHEGIKYRIKPDHSEEIAELETEYTSLQEQCYEVAKKLAKLRGE